jgi:predicted ATPase
VAATKPLELLSGLVDKCLVVAESTERSRVRYRMLEPVRQYALEKLEDGNEGEEVRRRHARFFLALAEEAEPQVRGSVDVEWFERLETEHDNIRAALSWALERGEAELALRLAAALRMFWEAHGHSGEGTRWLEAALAKGGVFVGRGLAARHDVAAPPAALTRDPGARDCLGLWP